MEDFFFPHDFHASKDKKLLDLRMQMGAEGYGVYWLLLEALASNASHALPTDFNQLGWELHLDAGKIKRVVCDFGLFVLADNGSYFYSKRLKTRLEHLDKTRQKRREAGKKGSEKRWGKNSDDCQSIANAIDSDSKPIANAIDSDSKPIANAIDSDSIKEKKRKENNNTIGNNTLTQEQNLNLIPTTTGAVRTSSPSASGEGLTDFQIVLNDKTFYTVTQTELDKWVDLYPAVDVPQELRNMQGWSDANPDHRKTRKGVRRFIALWLARAQNEGRPNGNRHNSSPMPNKAKSEPLSHRKEFSEPNVDDVPF